MSDPTPTTERVRSKFATVLGSKSGWRHSSEWGRDFDRWLAAHDAAVAAKALRGAADRIELSTHYERLGSECVNAESAAETWLRRRADQIEREGGSDV